jgi:hypothetical protein
VEVVDGVLHLGFDVAEDLLHRDPPERSSTPAPAGATARRAKWRESSAVVEAAKGAGGGEESAAMSGSGERPG